jgi:acyl phosphate:glycerol-3-phosphate acyltransferase
MDSFVTVLTLAFAIGYLLGSIPFGLLLTKAAGAGDVRKIGSGSIGATNVLRTGNKGLAAATLLLDAMKGTVAVLLVERLIGAPAGYAIVSTLAAGLGAFIGHICPVWLGFRGGKGVATYIGVLLGIAWPVALVFCAVWLAVAAVTRYSSLSALLATAVTPPVLLGLGAAPEALLFTVLSLLLFWAHRANIRRLLAGEEPRIGAKS